MDIYEPTKVYFREKNRLEQFYYNLVETLSEDELNILKKLRQSEQKLLADENMRFFMNGFILGTATAAE